MPKLRLMVATLVRCIPGMGHVLTLMSLLFYVYGVAGYHLYGAHDPTHWGTLGRALLTLFQIATLEAWTDIMQIAMELGSLHWIYFVSFVLLGTFVVVNLFVAVVINSLEESHREVAQSEAASAAEGLESGSDDIHAIRTLLTRLERRLDALETSGRARGERK
jgi:voltage-gated sodium channel